MLLVIRCLGGRGGPLCCTVDTEVRNPVNLRSLLVFYGPQAIRSLPWIVVPSARARNPCRVAPTRALHPRGASGVAARVAGEGFEHHVRFVALAQQDADRAVPLATVARRHREPPAEHCGCWVALVTRGP